MGTSKSYNAPTGGKWPPLKHEMTRWGSGGDGNPIPEPPPFPQPLPSDFPATVPWEVLPASGLTPRRLLSRYIAANGGAAGMAGVSGSRGGGGGTGGGGGMGGSHRTASHAARVGRNLGGFVTRVREAGLAAALKDYGLADLVGRSAQEVTSAIVERLGGPGSTMDAHLARKALNKLRQELLKTAVTFEDVERILVGIVEKVQAAGLIMQYYGHYLYERFARDFYESLAKKIGIDKARAAVESIRRTIFASLRAKIGRRDPLTVNWRGEEGQQLAERILVETYHIYEADA